MNLFQVGRLAAAGRPENLVTLAELTSAILLLVFIAINGALIALKRRGAAPEGTFTVAPWVPWFGVVTSAFAFLWSVL